MNVVKGKIVPLKDHVLVTDMDFGEQVTASGIVLRSDDGKSEGVKPRWGRVWAIGPEQKEFTVGEWILVEHGRWTRGATVEDQEGKEVVIRRIETTSVLASSDQKPNGVSLGVFESPQHGSVHSPEDFVRL